MTRQMPGSKWYVALLALALQFCCHQPLSAQDKHEIITRVSLYYFHDPARLLRSLNDETIEIAPEEAVSADALRKLYEADMKAVTRWQLQIEALDKRIRTSVKSERTALKQKKTTVLLKARAAQEKATHLLKIVQLQARLGAPQPPDVGGRPETSLVIAPANDHSPDPIGRVWLFAEANTSQIWLKGVEADVNKAMRVIEQFDRPVPQASIQFFSLQISGKDNNGINHALKTIDMDLRDARMGYLEIQNVMRNCLQKEINRSRRIGHLLLDTSAGGKLDDRLACCLFLSADIRTSLGYDIPLPFRLTETAGMTLDLDECRERIERETQAFQRPDAAAPMPDSEEATDFLMRVLSALYHVKISFHRAVPQESQTLTEEKALQQCLTHLLPWHERLREFCRRVQTNQQLYRNMLSELHSTLLPDLEKTSHAAEALLARYRLQDKSDSLIAASPHGLTALSISRIESIEYLTRFIMPDIRYTTTINESMLVLLLANSATRTRILEEFALSLNAMQSKFNMRYMTHLSRATNTLLPDELLGALPDNRKPGANAQLLFSELLKGDRSDIHALTPADDDGPDELRSPNRAELLSALVAMGRQNVAVEVQHLITTLYQLPPSERYRADSIATPLRQQYMILVNWLYDQGVFAQPEATQRKDWFPDSLRPQSVLSPEHWKLLDRKAWQVAELSQEHMQVRTLRLAAAQDSIKRIIVRLAACRRECQGVLSATAKALVCSIALGRIPSEPPKNVQKLRQNPQHGPMTLPQEILANLQDM